MKDSRKFWNNQAKNFDTNDNKESHDLAEKSKMYLKADMSVLDFACGTGGSTVLIGNHVKNVLGIDYSKEMIAFANNNKLKKPNVEFKVASLFDETLTEDTYDVIFALNIFHLLDNLDEDIDRLSKLLKDNGMIISNTALLGEKKSFFTGLINTVSKLGFMPSVKKLSVDSINKIFIDRNFEIKSYSLSNDKIPNYFCITKKHKI